MSNTGKLILNHKCHNEYFVSCTVIVQKGLCKWQLIEIKTTDYCGIIFVSVEDASCIVQCINVNHIHGNLSFFCLFCASHDSSAARWCDTTLHRGLCACVWTCASYHFYLKTHLHILYIWIVFFSNVEWSDKNICVPVCLV